jgi:hypothetical protein
MRILSLDLGVTTGWASVYLFKDGGASIVAKGVLTYEQYEAQIEQVLGFWKFDHAVIESPLLNFRGQLRDQLDNVVAWTMSAIGDLPRTEVTPAEWKGTRYGKQKLQRGLSQHEKDAIRMGLWFAETRLQGL